MKILLLTLIVLLPFSGNAQNISNQYLSNEYKFELQIDGGAHFKNGDAKYYGTEAALNYRVSDGINAGIGFLFSPQYSYDFYSPYGQLVFKSAKLKIAPYGKIAAGANFSSAQRSWPGFYFSVGAGAEYKLTNKVGVTAELTHKSFSFHQDVYLISTQSTPYGTVESYTSGKPYFSFWAPYIGVNWKF